VALDAPRVDDRRRDEQGRRQHFISQILPPYMCQYLRVAPWKALALPIQSRTLSLQSASLTGSLDSNSK
jgi:hypothetical protein